MALKSLISDAIELVDLPSLINEFYPDAKATPRTPGTYYAAWRDNKNTPALSLYKVEGRWLWSDKATGEGGNAFHFLTNIIHMPPQEAAELLIQKAGLQDQATKETVRPVSQDEPTFAKLSVEPTDCKALAGRGFSIKTMKQYGITADGPNALIPITDPHGVIVQIKTRYGDGREQRYGYIKGYSSPPWCSPDAHKQDVVILVEGELNAIILHASLSEGGNAQGMAMVGMPGADTKEIPYPDFLLDKVVYVYSDDDGPGEEARQTWTKLAHDQGARSVYTIPPLTYPLDFCDYAGKHSRSGLAEYYLQSLTKAKQIYGPADRRVGLYTVRQILDSAERYIQNGIIHTTGFEAIDRETGGIRESGIFGVGALSSIGKSAFMRRILIEHVRKGGKVRIYSPDQDAKAIYRMLASMFTNISHKQLRLREFDEETLHQYGTPEKAVQAWREAHDHVVMNIARRFQVVDESDIQAVVKDMARAVDQGVTMFGLDYFQLFERGRRETDGESADVMKKAAASLGVPVIACIQLRKSAFMMDRKDPIPIASDIEGSGAYFQSLDVLYMLYNDWIYKAKYAGPNTLHYEDPRDVARVIIRKDKEGEGDLFYKVGWVPKIAAFRDFKKMRNSLMQEREGFF